MVYQVELPQVGESVTEGIIGKWLVAEGDRVRRYDPIVEVITDKVNMEMPSPVAGVISKLVAAEGETLPMGAVIAEIEADEGEVAPTPSAPGDTLGTLIQGVAVGPTGAANVPQDGAGGPATEPPSTGDPAPAPAGRVSAPASQPGPASQPAAAVEKRRYSPAVRRLAEQHGVDLALVMGTGIDGRVSRRDVEGYVEAGGAATGAPSGDTRVPVSPIRKMIAANMVRSASTIPHAWSTVEADVSGLVALREAIKDGFRAERGHPITYLAFAVAVAAQALREHPMVNAAWDGDDDGDIVLRGRVNVGIAVAAPDGLIVPVIEDADRRTVAELAGEIDRLTTAARTGTLKREEVRGGTFTVNNTGALGSVVSGPIIVPGQAAILTTEAVIKRPVVIESEGDAVAVRSMMNLCMSFDHRLLDGAEVGAFLQWVKAGMEAIGADADPDSPGALG